MLATIDYRVVVGMANMQYALHGKRLIMQGPHCNVGTLSTNPSLSAALHSLSPCLLLCAYYNTIFFRPSIILCVHENRVCSFFFVLFSAVFGFVFPAFSLHIFTAKQIF